MNLTDPSVIRRLLGREDFHLKKSLGQNFLIDETVCPRMAELACAPETGVLEIGPGIGVLTAELAKRAKKVVAVELDTHLRPILSETLAPYKNASVVFGDVLKLDLARLLSESFSDCASITICANLPYYITSPVLMRLLESHLPIASITVMVQKEAAERLCAPVGSRSAGAITVAVSYYCKPKICFEVDRTSFMPPPNVDSAVIHLELLPSAPVELEDEAFFFRFVQACFAHRRKTLCNSVSSALGLDKQALAFALQSLGLPLTVRAEALSLDQLAALSNRFKRD